MRSVGLGATGLSVSSFCLGGMLMGTAMDRETSFAVLDHFREAGGNFIDTANCYAWWLGHGEYVGDESENVIGQWLRARKCRAEIVLATKVGARLRDPQGIRTGGGEPDWNRVRREYEGLSAAVIRRGIEDSLRRLGTDYIDLYYTHVFDEATPLEETLGALTDLIREGKVRHIGCSNITTAQVRQAGQASDANGLAAYTVMQQEYSYLHPRPGADTGITAHGDAEMFALAARRDMAFLAYSPLLKGIYGSEARRAGYYNWPLYESELNRRKLALVDEIAAELGVTGNQLVLAWLLRHEPQVIPLLGFSRREQYLENVAAAQIELSEAQLTRLNAA